MISTRLWSWKHFWNQVFIPLFKRNKYHHIPFLFRDFLYSIVSNIFGTWKLINFLGLLSNFQYQIPCCWWIVVLHDQQNKKSPLNKLVQASQYYPNLILKWYKSHIHQNYQNFSFLLSLKSSKTIYTKSFMCCIQIMCNLHPKFEIFITNCFRDTVIALNCFSFS